MLLEVKSVGSCCSQSARGVFARALLCCMQCFPVLLPCVEEHGLLRVEHLRMWHGGFYVVQVHTWLRRRGCLLQAVLPLAGFPGVCCTSVCVFA